MKKLLNLNEETGYDSVESYEKRFNDEADVSNANIESPKKRKKYKKRRKRRYKDKSPFANNGREPLNRYAIFNPNTYELVRIFDSISQLENYTNITGLCSRVKIYEKYERSRRGDTTIFGHVVVRWRDDDVRGLSRDEFLQFLEDKALGWMVLHQFERIRLNIATIDKYTLNKLFNYIKKIEDNESHKLLSDE